MQSAPAPAKINLGLHVLRVRPDGFRDIDTVFVRIPWSDTVSVEPSDRLEMTCSDPSLPTDDGNLCMRAARRLADALGRDDRAGARIHLDKRVPYGAGLGSGSSDAATTLELLRRLWQIDATATPRLHDIAAALGSDVPFFLGRPVARGTGRGEILEPIHAPALARLHWLVVVPPVHVATGPAYGLVTPNDRNRPDLAGLVAGADLERWRRELVNDFQAPVAARYPEVAEILSTLAGTGADYVSLSGSGSSVFAVYEDHQNATEAYERVRHGTAWLGPADLTS